MYAALDDMQPVWLICAHVQALYMAFLRPARYNAPVPAKQVEASTTIHSPLPMKSQKLYTLLNLLSGQRALRVVAEAVGYNIVQKSA